MTEEENKPSDFPEERNLEKEYREVIKMSQQRSIVLNYPNCCPHCKNRIIHPSIPVGEDAIIENDIVYFQCMNTACKKQFAVQLAKTDEYKHLFLLFAPNMPMVLMLLDGGQPQAIKADILDRMKKKYPPKEVMFIAGAVQEFMKPEDVAAWREFISETNALTEAPKMEFKPDGVKETPGKTGFHTILEEGAKASTDPEPDNSIPFKNLKDLDVEKEDKKDKKDKKD